MTTLPLSQAYSELVAAVVKAVPGAEKWKRFCYSCDNDGSPTLDDVLRAFKSIPYSSSVSASSKAHQYEDERTGQLILRILESWHLGHSLEWHRDNAPETIYFLHSILCQK